MFENQPEIIVLVGVPGSGKSTWIDTVAKNRDYVVVSSDNEIERLCAEEGLTYNQGFEKFVGMATSIMKQNFREAVNKGKNIIWDQTNLTPKKRRGILRQVPNDYYKVAVAFEILEDELNRRLEERARQTDKTIPYHVMKSMSKSYVPPSREEGFDEVHLIA